MTVAVITPPAPRADAVAAHALPPGRARARPSGRRSRRPQLVDTGTRSRTSSRHLTVAHDADADVLDDIEANVLAGLPLHARLSEAHLYVFDGARWRERVSLPFALAHSKR